MRKEDRYVVLGAATGFILGAVFLFIVNEFVMFAIGPAVVGGLIGWLISRPR